MELFHAGDSEDFAHVLSGVLGDDKRRTEMERQAQDYARAHSWREVARNTVEVYREAIADEKRLAHHAGIR
jgi:glycosyltransferase involved in cell wall biosynthesis